VPAGVLALSFKWLRSRPIRLAMVKVTGFLLLTLSLCTGLMLVPGLHAFNGALPAGGLTGVILADLLVHYLNTIGAAFLVLTSFLISLYLVSSFSLAKVPMWAAAPAHWISEQRSRLAHWRERRQLLSIARRQMKEERDRLKAEQRADRESNRVERLTAKQAERRWGGSGQQDEESTHAQRHHQPHDGEPPIVDPSQFERTSVYERPPAEQLAPGRHEDTPPWETTEIPIRTLEDLPPPPEEQQFHRVEPLPAPPKRPTHFDLPSTKVLNEAPQRSGYNEQELKDTAARIKAKFEEFHVLGSVVQINPGPVVTTFEYKPEAGIKYSRIITLNEDLCLGLQAESIFIERIPGKPTVGIEVPNSRRELIALREILESSEFLDSASKMTICLGKDINGRIKVASLETMPHLLIAGSTGSGKSVMLNSLIMSVLYKATPDEVRMILVDPKRVEMGIYEGIPHLLTPVITDAKQATNALRNAVVEMERRLKLLASQGVRNIDQFNRKMQKLAEARKAEAGRLFEEAPPDRDTSELTPLPYILIVIDELADLMMLERANVEASVTRLAQMARAVGMHLVLATQRPSVDVITGIIKANFPSRISFRVATRVDSRTVLDVMGAEHLLGKGDMLYLPPGSSRLIRVHGAFVTETEINRVVDHWKDQALPDYDQSYLMPPPSEDEDLEVGADGASDTQDPMYQDAVRVVLEMGKASTSILQRRLRLGYGRAARILDMMQRDGIIGPPDGSRPRDVLKRPDWLDETGER
jgi:S-DNA-T family DNA segregation ATPase FtsK/SpoIIIE